MKGLLTFIKVIAVFMYFKMQELFCIGIPKVSKYIWKECLLNILLPAASIISAFYLMGAIAFLAIFYIHEPTALWILYNENFNYSVHAGCFTVASGLLILFIAVACAYYFNCIIGIVWPKTVKLMKDNWSRATAQVAEWEKA